MKRAGCPVIVLKEFFWGGFSEFEGVFGWVTRSEFFFPEIPFVADFI